MKLFRARGFRQWVLSGIAAMSFCGLILSPGVARAADCAPIIQDALNWLNTSESGYYHSVGFIMTAMVSNARYSTFMQGEFRLGSGTQLVADHEPSLFSDRKWCPNLPNGHVCIGYQPYDYRASDDITLVLGTNSVLTIILETWGDATYRAPLTCTAGFLQGVMYDRNGNTSVTLSLRKSKHTIVR